MIAIKLPKMILFAAVAILACFASGCSSLPAGGKDVESASVATPSQFKEITKDLDYFKWTGTDKKYHYFETTKGFFRVTSKLPMPVFKDRIESMVARDIKPGQFGMPVRFNGEVIVYHKITSLQDNTN